MDIKLDIFAGAAADAVKNALSYISIDTSDVINTTALNVLDEIATVIRNDAIDDDFDVVEKIVGIFKKYNISAGGRHDFS